VRASLFAAAASSDQQEKGTRLIAHDVFPPWQAELLRLQTAFVRREGTIRGQMRNIFAVIGIVNLLFLALVLSLVRRFITRPVHAVRAAAARIASGDYSTGVPVSGNDEISALAAEFNRMSAQLQRNIGALRKSEQDLASKAGELERTNRKLEQYAFAAAHDLQEPIRTLSLYAQMLSKRCNLPPESAKYTEQIRSSAERMQQLVTDLLVHSRTLHEVPPSAPADPNRALAGAIAFLNDTVGNSGAVIRREPLPTVVAAEPDLELVFRNLIGNAIKYSGGKTPQVDISAAINDGVCTISVRDDGIGIHPEYHERVFGLFKRLHGSEIPGTGVGLALARNLIEKHGGSIWVESQPGEGATFRSSCRSPLPPRSQAAHKLRT
jgi:signal transduction histidine kinase